MSMRRRKALYTILIVLSCFLYLNWLVNIGEWKQHVAEDTIETFKKEDRLRIYEQFEAYDQDDLKHYNSHFVLMAAKTYENLDLTKFTKTDKLDTTELGSLYKILYSNKAFLLDLDILKSITLKDKVFSTGFKYNVSSFIKMSNYSHDSKNSKTILLTFGILLNQFENLNKELLNDLNPKCHLTQMSGSYSNMDILTSLYIECEGLVIQVAIVYERGTFLWIAGDEYQVKDNQRIFGDRPRAINRFELAEVVDDDSNFFYLPSNLKQFNFEYGHSEFIECNRKLAKENLKKLGPKHNQDHKRNKMISPVIEHISETLESFQKHYWLAGGTLLGWYRDCGIIPFTQDVDVAIWSHEYDKRIKEHFLGNKIVRVWGSLGLINDSFEFRMYNDKFTFDMFFVYKINETHQWCGYQVNRAKYRRFLPNFDKLCSAELLNGKYMVPCDPVKYLDNEYGPNKWRSPESKNYTWTNVKFSSNWTDVEWPRTIKYYDKNGALLEEKVISYVNKHLDRKKILALFRLMMIPK